MSFFGIMWGVMILRIFTYQKSVFNKIWRNSILTKNRPDFLRRLHVQRSYQRLGAWLLFNQEPTVGTPEHLLAAVGAAAITIGLATISDIYFERPIRRYGANGRAGASSTFIRI